MAATADPAAEHIRVMEARLRAQTALVVRKTLPKRCGALNCCSERWKRCDSNLLNSLERKWTRRMGGLTFLLGASLLKELPDARSPDGRQAETAAKDLELRRRSFPWR